MPRIVLVTGAAGGIGLATARAFAAIGDSVVLADIDGATAASRASELGPGHLGIAIDVADEAAVEAGVAAIARRFGRIDVVVNNAGIVDPGAHPALAVPLATVARLSDVNLGGTFVVAREAARLMIARRAGGAIVNIASGAALAALPGRAAYGMTKAAIIGLTRSLAREWGPFGVRVNAVLPGYVETEILRSLRREGRFDPATVARAIPLGRLAAPQEIAEVIRQIAGATSATGGSYLVDGGVDAFGGSVAASAAPSPVPPPGGCAVVLGGTGGTGMAMADRWVADGFMTIVLDRDPLAIAAMPADRVGIIADPADGEAVAATVKQITARFGPIGAFANAIGTDYPAAPSVDRRRVDFDRTVSAKLIGALAAAQAVAHGMIERGGGSIVHLIPAGGSAAAAGLALLTRGLACEWAASGIRVNAVTYRESAAADVASPAATADLAAFLASQRASYVTGAIWPADDPPLRQRQSIAYEIVR